MRSSARLCAAGRCRRAPFRSGDFQRHGSHHACLPIARAATGRDKILSSKALTTACTTPRSSASAKAEDYGDPDLQFRARGGGVQKLHSRMLSSPSFNNLKSVENRFKQYPGQIAAIILERS